MADQKAHEAAKQVTAYEGFAIYADYDANAPDTADKIWVSTEELAKEVCAKLNQDPRKYGQLAFVDGWEFTKSFQYHKVLLEKDNFARTMTDAFTDVEAGGDALQLESEPGEGREDFEPDTDLSYLVAPEGHEWRPGEVLKECPNPYQCESPYLEREDGTRIAMVKKNGDALASGDVLWEGKKLEKVV